MAKASGEGRASPLVRPPSCGKDPYEPWEMSSRERDVANKYLRFMTYHSQRSVFRFLIHTLFHSNPDTSATSFTMHDPLYNPYTFFTIHGPLYNPDTYIVALSALLSGHLHNSYICF